ncbi:hypothetical protein D3C76_878250 [compost metagenome]
MDFALSGNETQIDSFLWVIHHDMDIDEEIEKLQERLEKAFEGQTAHTISRVLTQTTSSSVLTSAGRLDEHIHDVTDYVRELYARCYAPRSGVGFPISLQFLNFVSYTPLRAVEE